MRDKEQEVRQEDMELRKGKQQDALRTASATPTSSYGCADVPNESPNSDDRFQETTDTLTSSRLDTTTDSICRVSSAGMEREKVALRRDGRDVSVAKQVVWDKNDDDTPKPREFQMPGGRQQELRRRRGKCGGSDGATTASGFFLVERLDGYLVAAERVAKMYEKRKKKQQQHGGCLKEEDVESCFHAEERELKVVRDEENRDDPAYSESEGDDEVDTPRAATDSQDSQRLSDTEYPSIRESELPAGRRRLPVDPNLVTVVRLHANGEPTAINEGGISYEETMDEHVQNDNEEDEDKVQSQDQPPHSSDPRNIDDTSKPNNPTHFDIQSLPRLVSAEDSLIPIEAVNFSEPKGTVGRHFRHFFIHFYGVLVTNPLFKVIVLLFFLAVLCFSCYNAKNVSRGIPARDVTPLKSYLRRFYDVRQHYFSTFGDECIVVFPEAIEWWDQDVQEKVMKLTRDIRKNEHVVYVMSGFEALLSFIDEKKNRTENGKSRKEQFMQDVQDFLATPQGLPYSTMFKIKDGVLTSWKFYYWMSFQDNTMNAIQWLQEIQKLLVSLSNETDGKLTGHVFTPYAPMWEGDALVGHSTLSNMIIALASMAVCSSLLFPDFKSGALVLLVVVMIDLGVYSSMSLWNLSLNMLTMVNLVLSIGFAVDYTAHITHCFSHCKGRTRNRRVVETLVLMGPPVTEGMVSTYAAVGVLFFSQKYALIVVSRMITLVMGFAFMHGILFMPVLLSLIGPFKPSPEEVDVVQLREGEVVKRWQVQNGSGRVIREVEARKELNGGGCGCAPTIPSIERRKGAFWRRAS